LFLGCLPPNLAGWLVLSVLLAFRAAHPRSRKGWRFVVQGNAALAKLWPYSTTFGPDAILLHPEGDGDTVAHELVHCVQAEGISLAWGAVALLSWSWRMVALWPFAWLIFYFGASAAAWLNGKPWYYANIYEAQAYAIEAELRDRSKHVQPRV
jgi:hypothetical protein